MIARMPAAKGEGTYLLKITLLDISPKIWRRFSVPAAMRLSQLHLVLQRVMGWSDSHLHAFYHGHDIYQLPTEGLDDLAGPEGRTLDERKFTVAELMMKPKDTLGYEYDFGDGWEHEIVLEKIVTDSTVTHPVCVAGKNACPPDDCGGPPGYCRLLEILADPAHEEHDHTVEWIGGSFDPDKFDLAQVNQAIKRIKP